MFSLEGKVALVTGGSGGIGRAICVALAKAGADIGVNYSKNLLGAEETARQVREAGRRALILQADVTDPSAVEKMVQQTLQTLGGLHILVNNSGITRDNLLLRMKNEEWEEVLNTNLKGAFYCIRAVAKQFIRQHWGRIINISSVVGLIGNPGQANYCASKAGLIGLTKSAAKELASRKVTVNAVAPGFIQTEMTKTIPVSIAEKMLANIPLGFFGEPEDVAGIVTFLASEEARYITGQVILVDGGLGM